MNKRPARLVAYSSILVAFAILIPIMMPLKIIIGPASFTLASHLPLFLATFISVPIAILVSLGASVGFLMAGFPIIIVLRALSHLIFAVVAAIVIKKIPNLLDYPVKTMIFAVAINAIHGLAEFIVVYALTASTASDPSYFWTMLGLIGAGSLVHGILDFYLAVLIWRFLRKRLGLSLL